MTTFFATAPSFYFRYWEFNLVHNFNQQNFYWVSFYLWLWWPSSITLNAIFALTSVWHISTLFLFFNLKSTINGRFIISENMVEDIQTGTDLYNSDSLFLPWCSNECTHVEQWSSNREVVKQKINTEYDHPIKGSILYKLTINKLCVF